MISKYTKPTHFQTKLFINNEFVDGFKKTTIPVINPTTEEKICEVAEATERDVELAVDAAMTAFPKWSTISHRERSVLLFRLADLIERDFDTLVSLESLDNGKPITTSEFDIRQVIHSLRYYAGWADKITGKTYCTESDTLFYTRREPFGVIGLITPWSFPLLMCVWKFAPALAAGNCVVHKPSEDTCLTTLHVCRLFKEAGFPAGVYNCVPGYGPIAGESLARSPRISKIIFSGPTVEGRKVMEASSQTNLKQVTLEFGGKTPFIVCPESDIDLAVHTVWTSIMTNIDHFCLAGSRLFIHETVYEEFIRKMKAFETTIKTGCPFTGSNHGSLVNQSLLGKILGYFDHAKKVEKLDCIMGGERCGTKGYFVKPTVYINVDDTSKLVTEDVFGPVLVVLKPWKTLSEVIQRVNSTRYGYTGVIVSNNMSYTERLIRDVKVGTIFVNTFTIPETFIPYGGYKESSFGTESLEDPIYEYTHTKGIHYHFEEPRF